MTKEEFEDYLTYLETLNKQIEKTAQNISSPGLSYNRSYNYLKQQEQKILGLSKQNVNIDSPLSRKINAKPTQNTFQRSPLPR